MGADGHLITIPIDQIPERFSDLDPSRIGWDRREFYGLDLLYSYWDTEGRGESYGDEFHEVPQRIRWYEDQIRRRSEPGWRGAAKEKTYGAWLKSAEKLQTELDKLRGKYSTEDLALAERYDDFDMWLRANADDWTVWT